MNESAQQLEVVPQTAEQLAQSLGVPFAHLSVEMVRDEALCCLPAEVLDEHNLLPLSLVEGWLTIAMERFADLDLVETIARQTGAEVQAIAAEADNIRAVRTEILGAESATRDTLAMSPTAHESGLEALLGDIGVDDLKVVETAPRDDRTDLEAAATDSPVVKLVNYVIQNAVQAKASDIHIEPDEGFFRVRYRVDGQLSEALRPSARLLPAVVSRIKIMSGMDISERRLPQDGAVTVTLTDRPIDLRVSTMATRFGEKVVMRLVDREAGIVGLEALGFTPHMLAQFREAFADPHGLLLVTGPTGSGKSTTLYGALAEIIGDTRNVSTIEDPIERRLAGANQFQVLPQAGFTFAKALRAMLRQDPDVIMVGEVRDTETAGLVTEAALTGHLVLSTLHTNDALTTVPRLVNMGVEPYLVSASVRAVLAQRLVRKLCAHCRRPELLNAAQRALIESIVKTEATLKEAFVAPGCQRCRQTGCAGRVGVFEFVRFDETMLSTITREQDPGVLREIAERAGMIGMLTDGLEKVRQGLIGLDGFLGVLARHRGEASSRENGEPQ